MSNGICINILSRLEAISRGTFRFDTIVDLILIVIFLAISIFFDIVWRFTTHYDSVLELFVSFFEKSLWFSDQIVQMWLLFLVMNFGGI